MFKNILEEKNEITKELFSRVLNLNVQKIKYDKTLDMDHITDYEFALSKIHAIVEKDGKIGNVDVYAKTIEHDRIKESIFCYWTLIYEEQFEGKTDIEMSSIMKKVSIEELKLEDEHKKSVFLKIQNNDLGILEHGTEMHFVEEYMKKYCQKKTSFDEWNKYLNIKDKEILLLSVIYTDEIHR